MNQGRCRGSGRLFASAAAGCRQRRRPAGTVAHRHRRLLRHCEASSPCPLYVHQAYLLDAARGGRHRGRPAAALSGCVSPCETYWSSGGSISALRLR